MKDIDNNYVCTLLLLLNFKRLYKNKAHLYLKHVNITVQQN